MRTKIYEESDYNVMLKTLEELTQGYDSEGNKVAAYFDVHELMDNFGITMEEAIDIAENNGYNVFRLPGGDNLVNQVVIAHGDLSYGDIVKEEESEIEVDDSVDVEEEDMHKQENLKEEVDVSIIGKPVKYRNEECTIKDVVEEDDDAVIILSNGKQLLASICVARGTLTSDDASVNAFLDKFKVEEEPEVEAPKEEPEKAVDSKDSVIQQALNDAREDWEEYKESSPMFKMVKQARKTGRYDKIPTAYPELYADTYYKEFDRLKNSVESKLAKNYAGIIERTYPGEVDELIFWLRQAITNIHVTSGDATMAITQERVDFFNDRDGTNATISRQNNKIFSSWIADLTQKEDILKDMPIEVLDWKIDKNNGKAFEEDELGLVYNKNNNELGSNAVVLDLLYEYDFKLGKQQANEELEEGLKRDVRIEYPDLEVELDTEDGLRTKTFHNVSYIVDRLDVLEALERITDIDIDELDERLDHYVEKYYEDLKDVFYDDAAKAQAEDYEENPDVYESCTADGTSFNEKLNGWSTEFVNEEDVEEGNEYKITKGDVITHYHLDRGRKPDKVEKDKYKVYFRRYKQLSNGGNYLDRNNWYEYGEGGYYFDSLEKARAKVVEYGKELKEESRKVDLYEPEDNVIQVGEDKVSKFLDSIKNAKTPRSLISIGNKISREVNLGNIPKEDEKKLRDEITKKQNQLVLGEAKKDEWEVKLIFKDGRTKIGLVTDNSEEASKFAKDQYKNNKEVKDFKVLHNGKETPFNGAYYDHGGYYQDHVGGYRPLGEDVEKLSIAKQRDILKKFAKDNNLKLEFYAQNDSYYDEIKHREVKDKGYKCYLANLPEDVFKAKRADKDGEALLYIWKDSSYFDVDYSRVPKMLTKEFKNIDELIDSLSRYLSNNLKEEAVVGYVVKKCDKDSGDTIDYLATFKSRGDCLKEVDRLNSENKDASIYYAIDDVDKTSELAKELEEDKGSEYEMLQYQLETELKNAKKRGASPKELRDIQNEYRDKMNKLAQDESIEEDIEKHDTLNPKLFDNEELKPEIKEKIEQIAYQFVNELNEDGIRFTLKDIVLLGSNVSYNYTKDSDLDIHLIADSSGLECPDNLYPLLYSAYRSMFNKNYDIRIKGIPAEIYVEMDEPVAKSNGIYSLNNGWLKKPEQRDIPDLDEEAFDKLFNEWEDKYFELMEKDATSEDIENFIEDLYDLRKESIATEGEYGLGNLVFKEFRNLGYLDDLKELRKEKKGKELSLEQLDEELKKTNASKLFKLLNTKVNELNVILSKDVENRKIDDDKAYNSAREEIEKGINVEGMWENIKQPNSYIIKCDLDKAKALAKALCQQEFITVEFNDENNFNSKLYHITDNGYNEIENSSEVVFDDDAKKLPYYSIIDGVAFSLGLYGNNFNLDENLDISDLITKFGTYANVDDMNNDESGRCFILKDGTLLKTFDGDSYEHDNVVNYINKGNRKSQSQDFYKDVYDAGMVKVNLGMSSIGLPKDELTSEQLNMLSHVVDTLINNGEETLDVSCDATDSYGLFNIQDMDTKDVLNRIKQYYKTGKLDEDNQLEKSIKLEVVPLSTYVNKWSKYSRHGIPKHALEVNVDEFEDELNDKPDALKIVKEFFREHPRAYSCIIKYYYNKYKE